MTRTVMIDPVTRIEGHAKISIHLDDAGKVADARFHVTEFRGFEKFCVGRSFWEMPGITARICGICPVSHLMASAKAGDAILGVQIPPTAEKLRRMMNWGQIIQSHALSFFHLSSPDLIMGMDSDPAQRNIMGLIQQDPELARKGIRLRQFGQEVIRTLGGKSIHPAWTVPGGVREPLTAEKREKIATMLPERFDLIETALDLVYNAHETFANEIGNYGDFPSLFAGLVGPDGELEHYNGLLRVVNSEGKRVEDGIAPEKYREIIGEAVEPWSYLKFPYYKPLGYANGAGMYRVGPLARLNVCDFAGTRRANRALHEFRRLMKLDKPVSGTFYYHYARLIEILFCLEKIEDTIQDPDILNTHVRSQANVNKLVGIGVSEAPRGTLYHEYHIDEHGIIKEANLIIATGQNNLAMNKTVRQIAEAYVDGNNLTEGMLNRVEHGIRMYDPCLSCSTHAVGQMPMHVQLLSPDGEVLDEKIRG